MARILVCGAGLGNRSAHALAMALALASVQVVMVEPRVCTRRGMSISRFDGPETFSEPLGWKPERGHAQPWYRRQRSGKPIRF